MVDNTDNIFLKAAFGGEILIPKNPTNISGVSLRVPAPVPCQVLAVLRARVRKDQGNLTHHTASTAN